MVITSKEPVYEVRAYAQVYVTLRQNKELDDKIRQTLEAIRQIRDGNEGFITNYHGLFRVRIRNLERRAVHVVRNRRGLFNFVGEIGSTLFGIPSPSDLNALKRVNRKLAGAVQGITTVQRQVIGKVNLLGRKQQQIIETLNQVIDGQDYIREVFSNLQKWMNQTTSIETGMIISLQLDLVEDAISEYQIAIAEMQSVRIACEAGIVTEQIVPIEIVRNLLSSNENHRRVQPLQYYAYMRVAKIIEVDDQHYCVLRAPLLTDHYSVRIGIHTFPVCQDERCIKLYQPPQFVVDYETEDLYFPEECFGPVPQVCQPGVKYDKTQQECLHGLINSDHFQQSMCPVTYYDKASPPSKIVTGTINRFVLQTQTIRYHYRCPQRIPSVGLLEEGAYVIDVEPHCILDAEIWMLQGLPVIKSNYTPDTFVPTPLNLSWFDPSNFNWSFSIKLPAGINKIEVPTYADLHSLSQSDLSNDIEEIQKDIGKFSLSWWMWLLIAVGSILALVFIVKILLIRKPTKFPCVNYTPRHNSESDNSSPESVCMDIASQTRDDVNEDVSCV